MDKDKQERRIGLQEIGMSLDDLVRRGARQVIQQAIEVELAQLLEQYENVKTLHGQRSVVRNGYLPEREVLTGAGPVAVKVPKVRDRSGSGVKFNSAIVPPYVRNSPRVSAALPWLYLKGISTGDMSDALRVLLGEDAKGLSANVVSRLKAGRRAALEPARSVQGALRLLVGRRHPHRTAQRAIGRAMPAGDFRRDA